MLCPHVDAEPRDRVRQQRRRQRDAVLHVDLCNVGVGALLVLQYGRGRHNRQLDAPTTCRYSRSEIEKTTRIGSVCALAGLHGHLHELSRDELELRICNSRYGDGTGRRIDRCCR